MKTVVKRDGTRENFDGSKIQLAIWKAMSSVEDTNTDEAPNTISHLVEDAVYDEFDSEDEVHVDDVHRIVENTLMENKMFDTAREYIGYRKENRRDIFKKRVSVEPEEYPELASMFIDVIHANLWTHHEKADMESDNFDMKNNMSFAGREIACRSMVGISQIEDAVKNFWGDIHHWLPKPEIGDVGVVFGDSEVRHKHAYRRVMKDANLGELFKKYKAESPAYSNRVDYLTEINNMDSSGSKYDFFRRLILFTMAVENVSLFSQFFNLMSFKWNGNQLRGISNLVEATSKEEVLHAEFGFYLTNIIKKENPSWWTKELVNSTIDFVERIRETERELTDWIFEHGDESVIITKEWSNDYQDYKWNYAFDKLGINFKYPTYHEQKYMWFEDKIEAPVVKDFFVDAVNDYSRGRNFSAANLRRK